ncbi:MAG: CsbD family protein [Bacillota bacterium]
MNKDVFKGKWNQLQGEIKKRWGKITDDDLKSIEGDIQKLIGKLQERYGMTKEEAEEAIEDLDI